MYGPVPRLPAMADMVVVGDSGSYCDHHRRLQEALANETIKDAILTFDANAYSVHGSSVS